MLQVPDFEHGSPRVARMNQPNARLPRRQLGLWTDVDNLNSIGRATRGMVQSPTLRRRGHLGVRAVSWQVAVLKILSISKNGEAEIDALSRDVTILASSRNGWSDQMRRSIPRRMIRNIFSDGLVTRPSKARWRITPAGRDYLHAIEHPVEQQQAAQ